MKANGWPRKAIGEVAQCSLGKMLDKQKNKGTLRPYLRNVNVRWFEFDLSDVLEMRFEEDEAEKFTARKGDVLICEGGYPGRSAIWEGDSEIFFQKAIHRVRFHESERNRWFLYYIYFLESTGELRQYFTGTGIQHFTGQVLKRLEMPLPPLPEQRRIVGILDEAFAAIANAKVNTEKNLRSARAVFESHVHATFNASRDGWIETTLDKLATNLDSRRIPITKSDRKPGEYPYYGASGIVDYVADYIFDDDILLISEDGANLLARSTPIAFSVSGKCWVNNHAHILKFEHMTTQRFVEFYLESMPLDEYITGAAQPKLNQKAMNSIPIPIPKDVQAQAQIVEGIESLAAETQRLAALYQRKLAALDALKKSLLHQAFSGEL